MPNDLIKKRDKTIDVMLSIGIVMVVIGHKYEPSFFYFPAYSFQVALFFFVSGYLAKYQETFKDKFRYVIKKTKSQLLPYFAYNLIFCFVTYIGSMKGLALGNVFCFNTPECLNDSLYNFFITPFISGHQYALYIPAWFLLQLYVVGVLFQVITVKANSTFLTCLFLLILITNYFLLKIGLLQHRGVELFFIRTGFGLLFYFVGFLLKKNTALVKKIMSNGYFLPLAAITLNAFVTYGTKDKITYSIVWGNVENDNVFIPIFTTFIILLITYWISNAIQEHLPEKSLFTSISKGTFYIMVFHLSVFLALNIFLFKLGKVEFKDLSNVYYGYALPFSGMIYVIPAVVIPLLAGHVIEKMKSVLKHRLYKLYSLGMDGIKEGSPAATRRTPPESSQIS